MLTMAHIFVAGMLIMAFVVNMHVYFFGQNIHDFKLDKI